MDIRTVKYGAIRDGDQMEPKLGLDLEKPCCDVVGRCERILNLECGAVLEVGDDGSGFDVRKI
jgi:hypothetical protein